MATIAENLQIIKDSVEDIKQAIIDKGGTISGNITTYASAIENLERLTSNHNYDVELIDPTVVSPSFNIKTINIKQGVTRIGDWAFQDCDNLENITIPESVTSIGEGAFYYCQSLDSIIIPESVTSIGEWAFSDCSGLTSITCKAITPPTIGGSDTFLGVNKSIPVYVPASSVETYLLAEGWSEFANIQVL